MLRKCFNCTTFRIDADGAAAEQIVDTRVFQQLHRYCLFDSCSQESCN